MSIQTLETHREPLTKGDVEEIVYRVVMQITIDVIFPTVARMIDEKIDQKLGEFAIMVKHGFDECAKKRDLDEFRHDTEQSLYELKTDMVYVKKRLDGVEERLDGVEGAVETMTSMWRDHETRICVLES